MIKPIEKNKRIRLLLLMTAVLLISFCGWALASGMEAEAGSKAEWIDLAKRVLNFVLLVILLVVALRKFAKKDFFTARSEAIRQNLLELKKGQDEAERKCRLLEDRLKGFEQQSREILEQYRAEGLAEKENILAAARQKAEQIIKQAEGTVRQEMQALQDRIKEELAGQAVQKAETLIAKGLTDQDQDQLVEAFIQNIKGISA